MPCDPLGILDGHPPAADMFGATPVAGSHHAGLAGLAQLDDLAANGRQQVGSGRDHHPRRRAEVPTEQPAGGRGPSAQKLMAVHHEEGGRDLPCRSGPRRRSDPAAALQLATPAARRCLAHRPRPIAVPNRPPGPGCVAATWPTPTLGPSPPRQGTPCAGRPGRAGPRPGRPAREPAPGRHPWGRRCQPHRRRRCRRRLARRTGRHVWPVSRRRRELKGRLRSPVNRGFHSTSERPIDKRRKSS